MMRGGRVSVRRKVTVLSSIVKFVNDPASIKTGLSPILAMVHVDLCVHVADDNEWKPK